MDLIASTSLLMFLWEVFKSSCFHRAGLLFMSHGEIRGHEEEMRKGETFLFSYLFSLAYESFCLCRVSYFDILC